MKLLRNAACGFIMLFSGVSLAFGQAVETAPTSKTTTNIAGTNSLASFNSANVARLSENGFIRGNVTHSAPVKERARTQVYLVKDGAVVEKTTTMEDGTFVLGSTKLQPGTYSVIAMGENGMAVFPLSILSSGDYLRHTFKATSFENNAVPDLSEITISTIPNSHFQLVSMSSMNAAMMQPPAAPAAPAAGTGGPGGGGGGGGGGGAGGGLGGLIGLGAIGGAIAAGVSASSDDSPASTSSP